MGDGCWVLQALPVGISPEVVLARVAGFDNASLGLPPTVYPLLTEINTWLLVASTPLSNARTRRFSPTARWQDVTSRILAHVAPQTLVAPAGMWIASVTPSFPSSGALPATAEADAFVRGVDFFADGPLMPTGTAATTMALVSRDVPCPRAYTTPLRILAQSAVSLALTAVEPHRRSARSKVTMTSVQSLHEVNPRTIFLQAKGRSGSLRGIPLISHWMELSQCLLGSGTIASARSRRRLPLEPSSSQKPTQLGPPPTGRLPKP
jgi:hypothetical protein